MRKLFLGTLSTIVCMSGLFVIVSEAKTQKTDNVTTEIIESIEESYNNDIDINTTMIAQAEEVVENETELIVVEEEENEEENKIEEMEVEETESDTEDFYEVKRQELLDKQDDIASIEDNKEWFLAYKSLIDEYSEWIDPPESIYDYFDDDEIYLMQRCVETETFEQDFDSKVNVASVILNRLESEEFYDSVYDVIVPGQFAYGRKNISEDTVLALEYAFMIGDSTDGALYFHSNDKTATFNNASYMFTDDSGHHFYK